MLLEERNLPTFPHPYVVWLSKIDGLVGLAISHTRAEQRVFGPEPHCDPVQYFFNPAGIQSVNYGAVELGSSPQLHLENSTHLSTTAVIQPDHGTGRIIVPMVNGMGFVTAIFQGLTPVVQSQVGFQAVEPRPSPVDGVQKHSLKLFDGTEWLLYTQGDRCSFVLRDNNHLVADHPVAHLVVQIGECPGGGERYYDAAAGCYAVSAELRANITENGGTGIYSINYQLQGRSQSDKSLFYALPHHVAAFSPATKATAVNVHMDSTAMGVMTGCITDKLEMQEPLPNKIGFMPWAQFADKSDEQFNFSVYSHDQLALMAQVAASEATEDINAQSNLDSMYFSGKGLDKFAFILFVLMYIVRDDDRSRDLLERLKSAFAVFATNSQQNPLCYDTTWKGLISVAGINGDPNADFGNSYYNDHHFHYSYFVHAAAIIGKVDCDFGGNWLAENKEYVNNLLRDVANPSLEDSHFPQFRSFDWYNGHSWAKGLFPSGDGKDEESSSEDYHFAYAMKMWGRVTGDGAMESRGDLMLAVLRRSCNMYMLYSDGNTIVPSQFFNNRVSGILFENKIDHATYFGLNPEYIHGIHMIPVTPISSWVRNPDFVRQEWNSRVRGFVDSVDSGWKGILKINQALYDPRESARFFYDPSFQPKWLDGGMSRTWCLAFTGGISH
ncbi:glucan endo-1,3-beta-D-glucosidase 2 [Trichomonascus vanleenenianus]|uniref:endo-1,3(4)-beta-glucanase n=1 Tax=Trichomonascus vanleenenianus TaxID=2268995 RepID=UPI003EC95C25